MKYVIPFAITGEVEIEAKDADHAQEQFDKMALLHIAANGELEAHEPELVEEVESLSAALAANEIPSPL